MFHLKGGKVKKVKREKLVRECQVILSRLRSNGVQHVSYDSEVFDWNDQEIASFLNEYKDYYI